MATAPGKRCAWIDIQVCRTSRNILLFFQRHFRLILLPWITCRRSLQQNLGPPFFVLPNFGMSLWGKTCDTLLLGRQVSFTGVDGTSTVQTVLAQRCDGAVQWCGTCFEETKAHNPSTYAHGLFPLAALTVSSVAWQNPRTSAEPQPSWLRVSFSWTGSLTSAVRPKAWLRSLLTGCFGTRSQWRPGIGFFAKRLQQSGVVDCFLEGQGGCGPEAFPAISRLLFPGHCQGRFMADPECRRGPRGRKPRSRRACPTASGGEQGMPWHWAINVCCVTSVGVPLSVLLWSCLVISPFCPCLSHAGSHDSPCGRPFFRGLRGCSHAGTDECIEARGPPGLTRSSSGCMDTGYGRGGRLRGLRGCLQILLCKLPSSQASSSSHYSRACTCLLAPLHPWILFPFWCLSCCALHMRLLPLFSIQPSIVRHIDTKGSLLFSTQPRIPETTHIPFHS